MNNQEEISEEERSGQKQDVATEEIEDTGDSLAEDSEGVNERRRRDKRGSYVERARRDILRNRLERERQVRLSTSSESSGD